MKRGRFPEEQIIEAIEDGMDQPGMKARMDDLERQKVEIVARAAQAPADVPDIALAVPTCALHTTTCAGASAPK